MASPSACSMPTKKTGDQKGEMMRSIHRWLSLIAALFLLMVASTGIILQFQRIGESEEHEREEHALALAPTNISNETLDAALNRALDIVRAREPSASIESVELRGDREGPQAVIVLDGEPKRQLIVNTSSGEVNEGAVHEEDSFIKRLHSGEVFGEPGVALGLFWGSALLVLALTGLWVYFSMMMKRAKARGKVQVFW